MRTSRFVAPVLLCLLAMASVVAPGFAQVSRPGTGPLPGKPVPPPPHPDGKPVKVALGVYLIQIADIDQINQTFGVDGYIEATWHDPRLAFDAEAFGDTLKDYRNQHALEHLGEDVWWPSIEFLNAETGGSMSRHWLTISSRGDIALTARFNAVVTSDMDLRRFPYDVQTLRIPIESYFQTVDDVVFTVDESSTGYDATRRLPEWRIDAVRTHVDAHDYGQYGDFYGVYSRFNFDVHIVREHGFYLWKVFLPLALIVAASWSLFWLKDGPLAVELTFTLLLTLVAFQFSVADSLPRVPYMTFLDVVITLAYLSVTLAIPVLLFTLVLEISERHEAERRVKNICRVTFPATFVACILVAVVVMM